MSYDKTPVVIPVWAVNNIEVLGKQCADTGTCHHYCTETCFRKKGCSPLSMCSWLNDDWTPKTLVQAP